MGYGTDLGRLPLAVKERTEQPVIIFIADFYTGIPKFLGIGLVGHIVQHPHDFTVLDLIEYRTPAFYDKESGLKVQETTTAEGFLTLSEALKIGTGVGVVAGIIGCIYLLLLTNIIEPDYWDKIYEVQRETVMAENPQLTQEQMDQGIEMQKKFAWLGYPVALIMYALFGLIVGLITGLITKKQKPAY